MLGVITLLLILYFLLFFTRIATIILVYTGLPENIARFQSRSAVTCCGFTTSESEQIAAHPVRRRVIANLMLVGSVGMTASISTLLLSFVTVSRENYAMDIGTRVLILGGGLFLLWRASRQRWFETVTVFLFEFFTRTEMKLSACHRNVLCHLPDGYRVSEIFLAKHSPLIGRSIGSLPAEVRVLGVQRPSAGYLALPAESLVLQSDDVLILYGAQNELISLLRGGRT